MENNKFKQFCNLINYNTYVNMQDTAFFSTLGLSLADDLITIDNFILSGSLTIASYVALATFLGLTFSHGNNYTKDISQIREMYYEFIKNYSKLNETFDLNNPVQIYTMFNYLLYQGYLSHDKNFKFSTKQVRDFKSLFGVNIMTGGGVCRHISAMLADILNESGIESNLLGVCIPTKTISIQIIEEQKYTKEELITWVRTHTTDEKEYKFVMECIEKITNQWDKNVELFEKTKNVKNPLKKIIGNHAITFATKDGKCYFLDATNSQIYRMSESSNNILTDENQAKIKIKYSVLLTNTKEYLKTKQILSNPITTISKDEENQMIDSTLGICDENTDIFEQFYRENSELYDEISNKMLKLRKNIYN